VTTCVGGFGVEPGRQQRATYYATARAQFAEEDPDGSFVEWVLAQATRGARFVAHTARTLCSECGVVLNAASSQRASSLLLVVCALVGAMVAFW